MAASTADVVVIGLGAVGSATLHRLALAGVRALGVDRFHPPHTMGSSHGETRITRLAIAEGDAYVPLARRSHAIWRELEAASGQTLFVQNGLLLMVEGEGAPSHGQASFFRSTLAAARTHAIAHETLDAAEITRRYPQFSLRGDEHGYFEPEAGTLLVERCIATQLEQARVHGAALRLGERVLGIEPSGRGVAVVTDRGRIEAAQAVLAAGAWLPELAGSTELARRTEVHRQVILWFDPVAPELYAPERCPAFIWMHGPHQEDYLYGFPLVPGATGVKAATERYPGHVPPDATQREVAAQEAQAITARHVQGRLRGLAAGPARASTCLYTVTPDAGFILDQPWGDGRLLAASACSGHGFKHAPALGEQLAQAVVQGSALPAAFALARFAA